MLSRIQTILGSRRMLLWASLAAFLLTLPSLFTGLSCDDYALRTVMLQQKNIPGVPASVCDAYAFVENDADIIRKGRETGLYPWWMPDEFQIAFLRPLACLTHWVDFVFFNEASWLMHLHSILWYALLGCVIALAYRRFISTPWVAGLAAFMYVADEARAVGVGWLAGRSHILAAIIGILVLLAHDRWRRNNWKPGAVFAVFWLGLASLLQNQPFLSAHIFFPMQCLLTGEDWLFVWQHLFHMELLSYYGVCYITVWAIM